MNIALGSGAQIALFVAPVIVFSSFFLGHPMRLLFSEFELLSVVVSVIILGYVATDWRMQLAGRRYNYWLSI